MGVRVRNQGVKDVWKKTKKKDGEMLLKIL